MRIGIVPVLSGFGGGIYQYSVTMLRGLAEWGSQGCQDEFVVFTHHKHQPALGMARKLGWTVRPPKPASVRSLARNALIRLVGEERLFELWARLQHRFADGGPSDPDNVRPRPEMSRWYRGAGVELMLYPAPNTWSFESDVPYVMAVHDLQHRLQPEFPEVSADGEWEQREYLFRNSIRNATLLLADSEVGKEDILNFYGEYGLEPERVKVLPFLPASYLVVDGSDEARIRVTEVYRLPEHYLFYPAQFWPHKNHARVIRALALLKQEHRLRIPVVFTGSYAGEIRRRTFHEAMSLANELGVEGQIYHLGYVPDAHMSALYRAAVALVMSTFFGPTNIPILEAWAFGCPVLTSDIRGVREQAGDAAVLADPRSVEAIAHTVYRLWTDDCLRLTLVQRGKQRLAAYTPEDYRRLLVATVEEAKARVGREGALA